MKCRYVKENNIQCNAYVMAGSEYCYMHNPEIDEDKKRVGQAKGGSKPRVERVRGFEFVEIQEAKDILTLLNGTISRVVSGSISTRTANTIGYLAGVYLKAFELTSLEQRVNALEQKSLSQG